MNRLRQSAFAILLLLLLSVISTPANAQTDTTDLTQYANPLNGTQGLIFYYGRTTRL